MISYWSGITNTCAHNWLKYFSKVGALHFYYLKVSKFGKSTIINRGVQYILDTFGHLPIKEQTITDVMEDIKNDRRSDDWLQLIVKEISDRLIKIGYWEHIPLPMKHMNHTLEVEYEE